MSRHGERFPTKSSGDRKKPRYPCNFRVVADGVLYRNDNVGKEDKVYWNRTQRQPDVCERLDVLYR